MDGKLAPLAQIAARTAGKEQSLANLQSTYLSSSADIGTPAAAQAAGFVPRPDQSTDPLRVHDVANAGLA